MLRLHGRMWLSSGRKRLPGFRMKPNPTINTGSRVVVDLLFLDALASPPEGLSIYSAGGFVGEREATRPPTPRSHRA